MNIKLASLCSLFFLFIVTIAASANESYNKAWEEFFKNNRTEARKHFTESIKVQQTKADAYLGLAILDWTESKEEAAFENIRNFYQASEQPDAYLYGLYTTPFTFSSNDVLENQKVEFLEEISGKPMHGTLQAMIDITLGKHYMGCRNFEKAEELFGKPGAIKNWQILGTFDNISGSGFDKDWGAVKYAQAKDKFANDTGANINWYSPGLNKADGWFDFTYYLAANNVIAYAQTFVDSPEAQDVYLRIGTSGSLKVWVNDVLVGSVVDERNCDMDVYNLKTKLNKGSNRILLQLGQSEISELNFLLRITNENGNPINGISDKAEYGKYAKSTSTSSNDLLPFYPEQYLLDKIEKEPANPIHKLVLAETYLRNDKAEEAIGLLRNIQQTAPKSSYIHYRLAEAYSRAKNNTYYTREIEEMKKTDPDAFFSLEDKSDEAISSNKINEVKSIVQKIKELYGENSLTRYLDSWIAGRQSDKEAEIAIANINYEKYPYRYGFMNAIFRIQENTLKDSKAATKVVEDYCEKYFNPAAADLLSSRYIQNGDTEKGLEILRDRIEKLPYATGYQRQYARTLYQMQRYQEALDVTDRILKLSPTLSDIYSLRGDIYKAMKDEKKAIENYRKTIYYNPVAFDARTQINQLEGKKEYHEMLPRFSLDSLITSAPSQEDYPDDNSIILLYDTKLIVYPEGASEYHAEMAVKIFNQTGVEIWKEYSIPYYGSQRLTLDKAEIIKENGQKVKAETNGGHIVFTNIEPGNTLYMEFRIKDYATDKLAKHFYDQYIFRFMVPTAITSYSILAPKDRKFEYQVDNGEIKPEISNWEDMKLHRWTMTNQPAVRYEPAMSSFYDISPTLSYSSIPDWEFIGNWYRDLTANKFKDDYLLKETVDEILKGKENLGQLEKAKLFYEYIGANITYSNVSFMQNNFIPQRASRTISTRLGDCKDVSTLFVAMCRKVGIEANLVLLISRDNGRNVLPLPANNFNHCIAQLKVDGKTYFLELTDNKLPFGAAPEYDLQSHILPIPYQKETPMSHTILMDMPFRPGNSIKRFSNMKFNDNDMIIETNTVRYASAAAGIRHSYVNLASEDRLKQMNQVISSEFAVPIKVSNLVFDELNSRADTAVYSYEVTASGMVQEIAGMKIFKIKWNDGITALEDFTLEKRNFPYELWTSMPFDLLEEELTVHLAEGKQFVEAPKNIHLECGSAVFDIQFEEVSPSVIKGKRTFMRKGDIVTPQEYEEFRKFMLAVTEADNRQYMVK